MAARNRCSPGVMAGLLALPMGGRELRRPHVRPVMFGIVPTSAWRAAVEAATGVGASIVRAMHLEAFDGAVLDLGDAVVGDELGPGRSRCARFCATRACPACLSGSGGVWLTWWKLGWAFARLRGVRRLHICRERRANIHEAFLKLEIRIVALRHFIRMCWNA